MQITVPRLRPKATATGTSYYWEPSATLKKAGWESKPLGTNFDKARTAAEALNKEVDAWRKGDAAPKAVKKFVQPETVAFVIAQYKAEGYPRIKKGGKKGEALFVSDGTKKEYDAKFRRIEAWAGPEPIAAITPDNVEVFRDALLEPDKDGEVHYTGAHGTLRVLRTLLAYAKKKKFVTENAANDFDLGTPPPRRQVWSAPARSAMEDEAIIAGEASMALAIALAPMFAQRQGDMLRIGLKQWQPVPAHKMRREDWETLTAPSLSPDGAVMGFTLRQRKTKTWIEVPVAGELRLRVDREISRRKAEGITTLFVDDRDGRPWDRKYGQTFFQRRFAEIRTAAADRARAAGDAELADELLGLQFRDYRRTGVVMYGELGLADQYISAITGHDLSETVEILETYMPRNTAMAAAGVATFAIRNAPAERQEKQA